MAVREMPVGHFAPVGAAGAPDRHLRYYEESAERAMAFETSPIGSPADAARLTRLARQIEKNERSG
jgi:hypothetical protein